MANELIAKDFSKYKIADVFKNTVAENDLGAGIQGGFGVVGYKGKTWSKRKGGEEELLMREDGDGPRSSIDVVILSSARNKSKTWYEKGYVEGSSASPDCFSNNGETPDPSSPKLQSDTCASCPRNVWGGRITENNKRAKECSDAKRLAVAFVDDLDEEDIEPLLLRVPAASLADLLAYGTEISKLGYPYYSVVTKVTFDPEESYPKFKFMAARPLNGKEGAKAIDMRNNPLVEHILSQTSEVTLVEGSAVSEKPVEKPKPAPKVINAEPVTSKSKVTPRKAAVARAEEIEDAEVVEEAETAAAPAEDPAAEAEADEGEDEDFDAALEAKLSAFLGGNKS